MRKFIIVSNRLPVSVSKVNGKLEFTPSPGGLATAMSSLDIDSQERLWIGWPGIASDELTAADKAVITRKLRQWGCCPVFLSAEQINNYYDGYANATLWPLFHYFHSIAVFNKHFWLAYKAVNEAFKKAVVRNSDPEATIWVHDYHLMLLPQLLRGALPASSIGFFLHIPFPSFEIFRLLPDRKEILEGLLGADLVGFHIYDYTRHFTSSVLRTLGLDNDRGVITTGERRIVADAFPIGIDYPKFTEGVKSQAVQQELHALDTNYQGQRLILSVDRLDYSKGIPERLEAFEQFLERWPRYHKKVVMAMVAVPSRIEVEAYKDLREHIEQTVSRINGRYGSVDWTPISYQFQSQPFEHLLALYARADVCLVTPLRDGMNLVAKEYVAAKQSRAGVLILSELTGAVDELPEALRITPSNTEILANAIKQALAMPKREQRRRLELMQRRIAHYTVQRWAADFLEQLEYTKQSAPRELAKLAGKVQLQQLRQDFQAAHQRTILLDYDGTLRTFVASPDYKKAAPPKALLALLKQLSSLPHIDLTIISGRSRQALEAWFKGLPITLVAEHGFFVKHGGEWAAQDVAFKATKQAVLPIMEGWAERTPGAQIEEKTFAVVWHYRNVPPELAYARNASLRHELRAVLAGTDIGVFGGNKIIEVKPRGITKGTIAEGLLAERQADFVLCIGDDDTDEDMFKVLPEEAYTIKVGPGETSARFQLRSVSDVIALLQSLTE